jgi:hypothetical protein
MPRYEPIDLGFSTADGESPVIHYDSGELRFHFTDWRESPVAFVASGVRHFAWTDELFEPDIREDSTYEVIDSPLIARYRQCNIVAPVAPLRHFKLCFNAQGVFESRLRTNTHHRTPMTERDAIYVQILHHGLPPLENCSVESPTGLRSMDNGAHAGNAETTRRQRGRSTHRRSKWMGMTYRT